MSRNANHRKPLNDVAWEQLFDELNILETIALHGYFEIDANTIRTRREPRLMTKFDHLVNLPDIFRDNQLAILPISRSRYVIGHFDCYQQITATPMEVAMEMHLPATVQSINPQDLYSESSALHCAHVSGMIADILHEPALLTISGRMSSKRIDFDIQTHQGIAKPLHVENSQIEIDAGFESDHFLMIVEAKKEQVGDFHIRQLYYPYRLWREKTTKEVIPVFFTHSNDIFSFYIYRFENPLVYNSLMLIGCRQYVIGHEHITMDDISNLQRNCTWIIESSAVPFPQADEFPRVVDLLGLLAQGDLTKENITLNYAFTSRQTDYYTNAAIYLGLVEKYSERETSQTSYRLSLLGRNTLSLPFKQKYLALAHAMLQHRVFHQTMDVFFLTGGFPDKNEVVALMRHARLHHVQSESTFRRRADTVLKWIDWIIHLTNA